MATKQRLGLRQVRALKVGDLVWDPSVPGFGARRQQGEAIAYVLKYPDQGEAASAGTRLAGTALLGHRKPARGGSPNGF